MNGLSPTGRSAAYRIAAGIFLALCALPSIAQQQSPVTIQRGPTTVLEGTMPRCGVPSIEFDLQASQAPIYNHASIKTMTQHAKSSHPTVGLYRARSRVHLRTRRQESKDTQEVCVLSLYISYGISHVIDIGSEYKPGTCAYEETLKHERTHEAIHLQKAREAQTHIARAIGSQPLYFGGPNYDKDMQDWLVKLTQWTTKVYDGYINPAQEAFDSPAEYERFAKLCEHELRYHGYQGAGSR